jgi:hypothetical protein
VINPSKTIKFWWIYVFSIGFPSFSHVFPWVFPGQKITQGAATARAISRAGANVTLHLRGHVHYLLVRFT